jgi:Family of unknown function (DUF5995)
MAERTALEQALAAEAPTSIAGIAERLQAIDAALPAGDGVSWFAKLYLEVTQSVGAAVVRGSFRDPEFLEQLDVAFAELFFDALRRSLQTPSATPKAWAPLLEARSQRAIAPIQFALAGMNAHINFDLPVALVATCERAGVDLPSAEPVHEDFERINDLLAAAERRVKKWFATDFVGIADVALGDVDDHIAMWNVGRARDAAWVQALTLWTLRGLPDLQRSYLETLDHVVGFAGRGLLVPLSEG